MKPPAKLLVQICPGCGMMTPDPPDEDVFIGPIVCADCSTDEKRVVSEAFEYVLAGGDDGLTILPVRIGDVAAEVFAEEEPDRCLVRRCSRCHRQAIFVRVGDHLYGKMSCECPETPTLEGRIVRTDQLDRLLDLAERVKDSTHEGFYEAAVYALTGLPPIPTAE